MPVQPQAVQTKRQIRALLASAGVRPQKRLGQHFLIDGNLMRRLVEAAELEDSDVVLEVGAGTGGLTDLLAERARHLVAVEIDRALFALLQDRFGDNHSVTLIHGDILERKHRLNRDVLLALRTHLRSDADHICLVSNLPYQVATPLMMNLLIDEPAVRRLCFTVQREVGERIAAAPNSKDYGPLSILSQLLCRVSVVGRLPPEVFWPRPAVHSVMIRMDVGEPPFSERETLREFAAFVRGVFDHRRKTLRSALGYVLNPQQRDRLCERFGEQRRPEAVAIDEWPAMFRAIQR